MNGDDARSGTEAWRTATGKSGSAPEKDWRFSAGQRGLRRPPASTPEPPASVPELPWPQPPSASYAEEYVADVQRGVGTARRAAQRIMAFYWALRGTVIAAGVVVAALAVSPVPRWVLAVLGALGAAAEAVIAAANPHERAVVRGLLADRMAREVRGYLLAAGPYAAGVPLHTFEERIEALRAEATTARYRLDARLPAAPEKDGERPENRQGSRRDTP